MAEAVCGYVVHGDRPPCLCPVGANGFACDACWRYVPLEERARMLAQAAPTELAEPESTCLVPACQIPDTAANLTPAGDGFLCFGHWRRVPTLLRHGVIERVPGAVQVALTAVADSERQLAGRFPPRPARQRQTGADY